MAGERVLIVDDEKGIRTTLGATRAAAGDGAAARPERPSPAPAVD